MLPFPCDLCSNLQSNVKFGPRIWHFLHFHARDPVFLTSWSELSQILEKWVLWVSCDTFQSSQSYVYLQLMVIGYTSSQIILFGQSQPLLYTITPRSQALTISLGPWKTHSLKNNLEDPLLEENNTRLCHKLSLKSGATPISGLNWNWKCECSYLLKSADLLWRVNYRGNLQNSEWVIFRIHCIAFKLTLQQI